MSLNKSSEKYHDVTFIDNQITTILDSLEATETDLQDFRLNNKIVDLSFEGKSLFEKLEKLQSEKAILKIKSDYYK